jgi:hypothetical protein
VVGVANAQTAQDFGTTGKTSKTPKNRHNHKEHQNRRLAHWIKNNSKGLLIGNACMNEITHSMGFQYVIQIKGQPGNRHEFGRFMNNIGAKTTIFFRNGPFWKIKLNRKRKDCRRLTGDHLG